MLAVSSPNGIVCAAFSLSPCSSFGVMRLKVIRGRSCGLRCRRHCWFASCGGESRSTTILPLAFASSIRVCASRMRSSE